MTDTRIRQEKFNVKKNLTSKSVRLRSVEADKLRRFAKHTNRSLNASILTILDEFIEFCEVNGLPELVNKDPNQESEPIFMAPPTQIRYTEEEGVKINKWLNATQLPSFNLFIIAVVIWFFSQRPEY